MVGTSVNFVIGSPSLFQAGLVCQSSLCHRYFNSASIIAKLQFGRVSKFCQSIIRQRPIRQSVIIRCHYIIVILTMVLSSLYYGSLTVFQDLTVKNVYMGNKTLLKISTENNRKLSGIFLAGQIFPIRWLNKHLDMSAIKMEILNSPATFLNIKILLWQNCMF